MIIKSMKFSSEGLGGNSVKFSENFVYGISPTLDGLPLLAL